MKINSVPRLLFSLSLIFLLKTGIAQTNPYTEVSITSPTSASLGKYGDIPVNYHTGIPQIGIPIYTVKDGSLQLPISLSYHASGLKVMEPSGWVGAGWALNAGGVITRTVQGQPDERLTSSSNSNQLFGYLSDHGFPNYLWYDNPATPTTTPIYLKDIYSGMGDGEPDLFFFNIAGNSGKFYLGDDGIPVILPQQDFKIEYDYTPGLFKSIDGFTITAKDGTKYFFGYRNLTGNAIPVERSLAYSANSGYSNEGKSISSWYLNKIQSADGLHEITLHYKAEKYSYFTISMFPVPYDEADQNKNGSTLTKVIIEGVRLSSISFFDGTVSFNPGSLRTDLSGIVKDITDEANQDNLSQGYEGAKSLADIQVSNSSGSFCKKWTFAYDYFIDNNPVNPNITGSQYIQTDKKRLKLLSIQEKSCDETVTIPAHVFEYTSKTNVANFLTRRLSFAQDHWGFYNGETGNTTLIPTYYENEFYEIPGGKRDSKFPEMRYGALSKITYPTGGSTEFDFEANTTWVDYNKYNYTYRFGLGVGHSGGSNHNIQNFTFTGNTYKVVLNNPDCSEDPSLCGASLTIKNQSGVQVFYMDANVGQPETEYITLSAGIYSVDVFKNIVATNSSAEGLFTELVPIHYQNNETIGGLRIKSMKNNDGIDLINTVTTNYSYLDDAGKTGILYSRPRYVQVLKNSGSRYTYQPLQFPGATWYLDDESFPLEYPFFTIGTKKSLKSPSPLLPMSTTQGSHIGYNSVKVSQSGSGYSIYHYQGNQQYDVNDDDVAYRNINTNPLSTDNSVPEYPAPPEQFDYTRGEIISEKHWNEANQLVREVIYSDPEYQESIVTTPGLRVYTEQRSDILFVSAKTDYELKTSKKVSQIITERLIDPVTSKAVTTLKTVFFESPNHNDITSQTTTNSLGEELKTKMKYVFDFLPAGCMITNNCWNTYSASLATNQNLYVSEYNACSDDDCRKIAKFNKLARDMEARRFYSDCRIQNVSTLSTCIENAKAGAAPKLKSVLELYQQYRNCPIEVTSLKAGKVTSSIYNGYDFSVTPANKVYPDKNQMLKITEPLTDFATAAINGAGTSISKDNRYEDEKDVTFENGTLTEITGKDAITKSYIWGYNNTLPLAMVSNAAKTDIAFTSFEDPANLSWIVSGTPQTDINPVPAGKKIYAMGSGNITKSGLTSNQVYILSYWSKTNTVISVSGANVQSSAIGKTVDGWKYQELEIKMTSTALTLSGSITIDELRLYPEDAQMVSYTYDPLFGITSQTDNLNRITYYEYDKLGRLRLIRDQDKFILNRYCYNYTGQSENCDTKIFFNTEQFQSFTKNDCPSGQVGDIVPSIVSAGTFSSFISTTDANQKALDYITAHGQSDANGTGNCSPITNVTISYGSHINTAAVGFKAVYKNKSTNIEYTFNFTSSASGSFTPTIPSGEYDITISKTGNTTLYNFYAGCGFGIDGAASATFYNISVRSTACNTVTIYNADE